MKKRGENRRVLDKVYCFWYYKCSKKEEEIHACIDQMVIIYGDHEQYAVSLYFPKGAYGALSFFVDAPYRWFML
jgi:hypothetical protein